ncbi:MAG: glycosyltransferase family 39 protein [Novosphingobium sp.]
MKHAMDWFSTRRSALLIVWALFILPRALMLLPDVVPTSDADWYFTRAALLSQDKGYLSSEGAPTAYWPVGWPLMMSLIMRLAGPSVLAIGLFNLLCAVLSGWLLLALSRRLHGSELAARAGLLLYAVYPNAIGYVPLTMTEVFYTLLLLAICFLLVARPGRLALLWAGLLLGIASLVKAQTLVVVPLILAIGLLRQACTLRDVFRGIPRAAGQFVLLIALAAAVVTPWTLRNRDVLGHAVAVSTNGGLTLLTGNNDSADGGFVEKDPAVQQLYARALPEVAEDAEAKRLGLGWIASHPARFAALLPLKAVKLWATDGEAQWAYELGMKDYARHDRLFDAIRWANQIYYWLLLAAFAAAAVVIVRRRMKSGERLIDWWLLPYGIAAYPTAIALVFSGQSRFHFPVMPFVCLTVGWLLADWLARRTLRKA